MNSAGILQKKPEVSGGTKGPAAAPVGKSSQSKPNADTGKKGGKKGSKCL